MVLGQLPENLRGKIRVKLLVTTRPSSCTAAQRPPRPFTKRPFVSKINHVWMVSTLDP
ncbi:hypothetical protein K0M31_001533, partial [Melipona bicolor]